MIDRFSVSLLANSGQFYYWPVLFFNFARFAFIVHIVILRPLYSIGRRSSSLAVLNGGARLHRLQRLITVEEVDGAARLEHVVVHRLIFRVAYR